MSNATSGTIDPGQLYLADEARQRLRLGNTSWRRLRKQGLRVVRFGRNVYVRGDELIRALSAAEVSGQ